MKGIASDANTLPKLQTEQDPLGVLHGNKYQTYFSSIPLVHVLVNRMETYIHPDFAASDGTDVTIQSSDGAIFYLHRKNLEVCTGAFPGAEFETKGEIVILTEPAEVLQILFQFIYPKTYANLEGQGFEIITAVSEAVGKYEVFPAIDKCVARLIQFLPAHVEELLLLGCKHDYTDLINEAALHIPLPRIVTTAEKLPASWIIPWLKFMDRAKFETFELIGENHIATYSAQYAKTCCGRGTCADCHNSIFSWIRTLESQSLRAALNSTVQTTAIPILGHCKECTSGRQWCCYMPRILADFKEGFAAIPRLTDVKLYPGNYSGRPVRPQRRKVYRDTTASRHRKPTA